MMMPSDRPRPRLLRRLGRGLLVLVLPCFLGGCLVRTAAPTPARSPAVATVPGGFLSATPALAPPPSAPPGRYVLGQIVALPPGDARAGFALPSIGQEARAIQIAMRIEDLREPRPPEVAYELVTPVGVFAALAEGEWERAVPVGEGYRAEGVLLFVVPRDLRSGRLEIVDYYYPRLTIPGGVATPVTPPLVRRVLATFALDRLP